MSQNKNKQTEAVKITAADLASRLLAQTEKVVVMLVGPPASGKTTLSQKLVAAAPFTHLNADSIRAEVTGDENSHERDNIVWMKFTQRYETALAAGAAILVDNMNHTRAARAGLIRSARKAGYAVKLVFLEVPLAVCIERNRTRGKDIADHVIMEKYMALKMSGQPLEGEEALRLLPCEEGYALLSEGQSVVARAYDIVGDVHGCADELIKLLSILGYKVDLEKGTVSRPRGRNLVFVGDLTDRGPNSAKVLHIVMLLVAQGAVAVLGNHCWKLMRCLQGYPVKVGAELTRTIEQIRAYRPGFEEEVLKFLASLKHIFETPDLIVVHGAYKQLARGEKAENLALYGETSGKKDKNGFPERLDSWETAYMGGKTIVHGHVPVREPTLRQVYNDGCIVNVDTACCFGGKLTALRFPEMEFISTPAGDTYSHWHRIAEDAMPQEGEDAMASAENQGQEVVWNGAFGIGAGLPLLGEFETMEKAGWIWSKRLRTADGRTYRLFNYSKSCAYERVWNPVTTISRGLIICEETGEVVAASMPKFFNLGETVAPGVVAGLKDGHFEALVKLDGSCGIGYRLDDRYMWATRGSFSSEQAAVAQAMWDAKYAHNNALLLGEWHHLTLIAEIIHPETRVVCRYDFQDLVLIAARDRFTGTNLSYGELKAIGERLGMPVVERIDGMDAETLVRRAETLDDNSEGFVFHWPCGHRVKVKGTEYKRLHRLLSGITPRELANSWWDNTISQVLRLMPEEFREETEALVKQLDANTVELARQTEAIFQQAGSLDQKSFAAWVKTQPAKYSGFLFARRLLESDNGPKIMARAALANLFNSGQLEPLLSDREAALREALDEYLEAVGGMLWEATRPEQDIGKLRGLTASLPRSVRGTFDNAISNLLPQLIVEKMRDFMSSQNGNCHVAVDIEAVFAAAPPATAPEGLHNQWVFSQPSVLRPFLDRYRYCSMRQTAQAGARKLLADAVRAGAAGEYLEAIQRAPGLKHIPMGPLVSRLKAGLQSLEDELGNKWKTLPLGRVEEMAIVADDWSGALRNEAWAGQRTQVRDLYIASDPQMKSFNKLEEA